MRFITSAFLLASAVLSAALPVESPVQKRDDYVSPASVVRLYEAFPNRASGPSDIGETSRVGGGLTGISTLLSFQLDVSDGGATCNLRFHDPSVATGSKTFALFEFVPNNGDTFNPYTASWNSKGGYRNQQLTTYKYVKGGNSLVYSTLCPSGGKKWNFEFVSANGDNNLSWDWTNGEGPYLEIIPKVAKRDETLEKRAPVNIPLASETLLREQYPNTATGPVGSGEVSQSGSGKIVTTLIGFIFPSQDLSSRTCVLKFSNPTVYTGSKKFSLFEFIPNNGRTIFDASYATWNFRTGYRNRDLGIYTVTSTPFTVYTFKCPAPGSGVSFDVAPSNGDVSIKWNNWNGGFTLTAL